MPNATSLIALDVGTSSARAALFRDGRVAAQARRPLSLVFPDSGRVEQDARELAAAARALLDDVTAELGEGESAALGITNQRSTVVLWEAETGKPLGPALSWRDSRAVRQARALAEAVPDLAVRTGLPASPHYGAAKIAWALAEWPEARAAADAGTLRVGPVSTWLTFDLTRGESFTIDPTNAQRMQLLDLRTLEWDPDLVRACGVPPPALPQVLPTDGYFGDAHASGRVVPIRTVLGDQQAALLGIAGGPHPVGSVGVQLGTGGFVLKDVGAELRHVEGLLSGIARADANHPRRYLVEGTVNSAGSALDRLKDLGLLRDGEDVDAVQALSTSPAVVVPGWSGLGAPWWEPRAKAALLAWDESTTRADVVAGTLLGIAFLVADVVDGMVAAGLEAAQLELSGPVSRIHSLSQAVADATRRDVHLRTNPEASLEGVALALATACGGVTPVLSVEVGRRMPPAADLTAARVRFAEAREAVLRLARQDA